MNITTPTLYILCGFPFSGKTVLARKLLQEIDMGYVAIDDILFSRGFTWDSFKEYDSEFWKQVFQSSHEQARDLLKQGKHVLYDSANQDRTSRDKLRKLAKDNGASARVIHVNTPEKIIWQRWKENKASKERFDIPRNLIEQTIKAYEPPGIDEDVIRYSGEDMHEWIKKFQQIMLK